MKIVFFGTSPFAAKVLQFLIERKESLVAVVTRPDRPKGRSQQLAPSAVKELFQANHLTIPLLQPEKASSADVVSYLKTFDPDLFLVVAYGEIIKQSLLDLPKLGAINIHASLLPKYRGAAPIQRAIMNGEKETGITIIEMVLQMDAGDMLKIVKCPISEQMTFGQLHDKLASLACDALASLFKDFAAGCVQKIPQDDAQKTFAPKMTPVDQKMDWRKPAQVLRNQIRALSPSPGARASVVIDGKEMLLKILQASLCLEAGGSPGELLKQNREDLVVACGEGALLLEQVQLEGKKAMPAKEFLRGLKPGVSLQFLCA